MKSKEAFLNALQQGIAVLEESEQRDILEEYTQHIELKMSHGRTEEEVIGDFGDVQQLISEILEAYHVDPMYAAEHRAKPDGGASKGDDLPVQGGQVQAGVRKLADLLGTLFGNIGTKLQLIQRSSRMSRSEEPASRKSKQMVGYIVKLLKGAAWVIWNGGLLLCAVPIVLLGIAALLLLGTILVWLIQGMPLTGSFLCCIGILATCVGVLGVGKNLIWHRHPATVAQTTEPSKVPGMTSGQESLAERRGADDEKK